jgi:hypothetical protein
VQTVRNAPRAGRKAKQQPQELGSSAPWLALIALLLVLLGVSAAVAIRSGLFNLGKPISTNEYRALLLFVASGLGTAATTIGLLFTRSHNQETSSRLTLDTVVKSLELLTTSEGIYAPKAKIAGALATLVHLEQPVIAMRTLSAAWDEGKVDTATACWLISEVFRSGSAESKLEASGLLLRHASELTGPEDGDYEWPDAVFKQWPSDIPLDGRGTNSFALIEVLLSRDKAWWGDNIDWIIITLYVAYRRDNEPSLRTFAARALKEIVQAWQNEDVTWQIERAETTVVTIKGEIADNISDVTVQPQQKYIERLNSWLQEDRASPQEAPSTPRSKRRRLGKRSPPSPNGS